MATCSVSVVCTVKNEAANIETLLHSLAAQTRPPNEIVIVDGGSNDETWDVLTRWRDRGLPRQALRQPDRGICFRLRRRSSDFFHGRADNGFPRHGSPPNACVS